MAGREEPCAGKRDGGQPIEAQHRPVERRLERRRARGVPDQTVAELERRRISGTRRRHPEVREARTAAILHGREQSRPDDLDARHAAKNRT